MNGPTHQFAGAIAALVMTQNDTSEKTCALHHPAAAIPIGAFLGKLPDMIEPALGNPNHRQFFHSVVVLGLLAAGMRKVYHLDPQNEVEKILRGVLLIGGAAYLSHLALDALTSRSLPLVGRL
ncbi:MAG TPA: metal-dependent hydrolase [Thiohalobacter sp.]|nr:metal-dependent hydrolase [Thiohalobacter sp.]